MLSEDGLETDVQITATAFEQDTSFIISNDPTAQKKQRPQSAAVYKSKYNIRENAPTARYMQGLTRELKSIKKVPTDMFKDEPIPIKPKTARKPTAKPSPAANGSIIFDSEEESHIFGDQPTASSVRGQTHRPNSAKFPFYNEQNIPCTLSELDNSYALDDLYYDEVFGGEKSNHYLYRHYNGSADAFRREGQVKNPAARRNPNPFAVVCDNLSKDVDISALIASGTEARPEMVGIGPVSPIRPATASATMMAGSGSGFDLASKVNSVNDLMDMKMGRKPNSWYFEAPELDAMEQQLGKPLSPARIHPTVKLQLDRRLRRLFKGPVPAQGDKPGVDISEQEEGGGGVLGVIPLGLTAGKGSVHIPTEKGAVGDLHSGNLELNYASQLMSDRNARSPEAVAAQQRAELEARYDILETKEVMAAKAAEKHRAAVDKKLWLTLSERAQNTPIRPRSATLAKVMEIYFPKTTLRATAVEAAAEEEAQREREREDRRAAVRAAVAAGGVGISAVIAAPTPTPSVGPQRPARSATATVRIVDCDVPASGSVVSASTGSSTDGDGDGACFISGSSSQRARPLTASGALPSPSTTGDGNDDDDDSGTVSSGAFPSKLRTMTGSADLEEPSATASAANDGGIGIVALSEQAVSPPPSRSMKKGRPKTSTGVLPRHPGSAVDPVLGPTLRQRDQCTSASAAVRLLSAGTIRRNFKPKPGSAPGQGLTIVTGTGRGSIPRPFSGNTTYSNKHPSIRNKVDSRKAVETLPFLGTLDAGASASRMLHGSVISYSEASIVSNDVTVIKNYEAYIARSDYQKQCDAIRKFYVHTDGPRWKFQHGWATAFVHITEQRSPVNRQLIKDSTMEDYVHKFMGDDQVFHGNVHSRQEHNDSRHRLVPFVQDCDSCELNLEHRSPARIAAAAAATTGRDLLADLDDEAGIIDDDTGDDGGDDSTSSSCSNQSGSGSVSGSNSMSHSRSSQQSLRDSFNQSPSQVSLRFTNSAITLGTADSIELYPSNYKKYPDNQAVAAAAPRRVRSIRSAPMPRTGSRASMTPSQIAEDHLRYPSSSYADESEEAESEPNGPVYGLFDSSWYGLEVLDCHVIELNLSHNNLRGFFPDCLQYLVHLEVLDLGWNDLMGHLPEHAIMAMSNLRVLSLQSNQLGGQFLPVVMGSMRQIEEVWCGSNKFEGEVPSSIGECSQLTHICLANNLLRGDIPRTMVKCKQLRYLSLSCNKIDGPILPWVQELPKLEELYLYKNRMDGHVPEWIEEIGLKKIEIYNNDFEDTEFSNKYNVIL